MDIVKESNFKIKTPKIKKIEYEINESYEKSSNPINLNIRTETKIYKSNLENKAVVSLELQIFDKSTFEKAGAPFYINIIMFGEFGWDESVEGNMLNSLLETNAPAVLLSYMRPYISSLTSGSGHQPLIIPLLNFRGNKAMYIQLES